ncbi:ABC transporter permease [Streptacidiphilus sp. 4-A2]|nr:ABC transporter permease [Streptacidiphilus sp. 4-A2]
MRAQFVISETLTGLRRNMTMTVAVIISVAMSLALAGAALLLRDQVDVMQGYWAARVEVSVYFCTKDDSLNNKLSACASGPATQGQENAVLRQLEQTNLIEKVYTETPEQEIASYKQQDANSPDISFASTDAFNGDLQIKLKNPTQYLSIIEIANGQPGVGYAEDDSQVLKPLFRLLDGAQVLALSVMVIMLAVTTLLIVNTVRISAFSRKRETGIKRLVGASNYSVQFPFIAEAALAGIIGAVLASGMLALVKYLMIDQFLAPTVDVITFIGWGPVFQAMPLMLILGVGMSGIAAFVTLRKYLQV